MNKLAEVDTYYCNVYIGMKEGYSGLVHKLWEARSICSNYCKDHPLGVTVTPTEFIYVNGMEDGVIIGLINYPRFPSSKEEVKEHAERLGEIMAKKFKQHRFSIQDTEKTTTYELEP